jgi:hypothetical protein
MVRPLAWMCWWLLRLGSHRFADQEHERLWLPVRLRGTSGNWGYWSTRWWPFHYHVSRILYALVLPELALRSGDPGADLFTSPWDPAFYLHHGQIDRMWTLWYGVPSNPLAANADKSPSRIVMHSILKTRPLYQPAWYSGNGCLPKEAMCRMVDGTLDIRMIEEGN